MLESLAIDRRRILELDTKIAELRHQLEALSAERDAIHDRLSAYTYPVHSLPSEVVSEIFLRYIPPYPGCSRLLGYLSPTNLGHVCRLWRQIAHSTPALWRAMEITVSPSSVEKLPAWLQRSATLPLSILLNGVLSDSVDNDAILDLVLPHRERWQYLAIAIIVLDAESIPKTQIQGYFPALRALDVSRLLGSPVGSIIGSLQAPGLSTALLDLGDSDSRVQLQSFLPWAHLTRLALKFLVGPEVVEVLRLSPNLVHLHIALIHGPFALEGVPMPAIDLPLLRTLVIGHQGSAGLDRDETIRPLLLAIRAPALSKLFLNGRYLTPDEDVDGNDDVNSLEVIVAIIKSLGCRLEQLCLIYIVEFSVTEARAALPTIPLLDVFLRKTPRREFEDGWDSLDWDIVALLEPPREIDLADSDGGSHWGSAANVEDLPVDGSDPSMSYSSSSVDSDSD
uniref:F-box domain-containing protein n=1 Tax=Mycena chlorophos TaxID=658473 RepID=A0ABQ0M3B8_MYCCL|nr:predicted protein [Mycena chlorophos]